MKLKLAFFTVFGLMAFAQDANQIMPASSAAAFHQQILQTISAANYYKTQAAGLTQQVLALNSANAQLQAQVTDLQRQLVAQQNPTIDQSWATFIAAFPDIPKQVADFLNQNQGAYVAVGPIAQ